jgi:hypothetical protein
MNTRQFARFLTGISIVIAMFSVASCSRMKPAPPLTRRVAVLDFKVPTEFAKNNSDYEGWWFSSREVMRNPRAGELFADILSREILPLDYLEQNSRTDLKFYIGKKRSMLMDTFKGYDEKEYTKMLDEISPLDYGLELGVDQVITGRIIDAYTSTHSILKTWHSKVSVEVNVWDMHSGQIVWSRIFTARKNFLSQSEAMIKASKKIVRALDKTYYQRQDPTGR